MEAAVKEQLAEQALLFSPPLTQESSHSFVHRLIADNILLTRISRKLDALLGISTAVREKIRNDLSGKNLLLAERYLVVRTDGWHVFADDATPFKHEDGYFVIDWHSQL